MSLRFQNHRKFHKKRKKEISVGFHFSNLSTIVVLNILCLTHILKPRMDVRPNIVIYPVISLYVLARGSVDKKTKDAGMTFFCFNLSAWRNV